MKKSITVILCFVIVIGLPKMGFSGTIDSPGDPSAGSGMYTLQDIYDFLLSGTSPVVSGGFQEPISGPGSTMITTSEIYNDLKALFDLSDATPNEVLSSVTFFSTDPVNWGPLQGSIASRTVDNTTVLQLGGIYSGFDLSSEDTDLVSGNIRAGVDIFGVTGDANVVDTTSGDATAGEILSGKVAWVDGNALTGTLATQTLSSGSTTFTAGYYNATTLDVVDADLVSGNIRAGVSVFGVDGNANVVDTSSGTATAGDMLSGSVAWVAGSAVTGTLGTQTLSSGSTTVSAGYYNATTLDAVDADLISGNIKSGITLFGVTGSVFVVDTTSGDATASDILNGKVAWVDGSVVTGTYPLAPVARSGVTTCYHTSGATIISCTDTGQDGDWQKGVALPNPRFTDNGDGTVTDNLTGLIWIQEADCFSAMTWDSSLSSVNALKSGDCFLTDGSGVSEWRLPNLKELLSLIDYGYSNPALTNASGTTKWSEGDPFSGVTDVNGYWTSTSYIGSPGSAWSVDLVNGGTTSIGKSSSLQAWPVKGGE